MIFYFKKLLKTLYFACKIFYKRQYTYRASALAFTTLFAIVPYAIVMIFFATWFPAFNDMLSLSKTYVITHFLPNISTTTEHYFQTFIQQANHLPTLNILFFITSAVIMINTIEDTLNNVWRTNKRNKIYLSSILYFILIIFIPITIGLSAALSSYAIIMPVIAFHTWNFELGHAMLWFVPIITNTVIFSLIYILVPNVTVKIIDGIVGGLFAALLLELARFGFGMYLTLFPSYALIYGAFATIPIFLIWLYIFWIIFIFCALFTAMHATHDQVVKKRK